MNNGRVWSHLFSIVLIGATGACGGSTADRASTGAGGKGDNFSEGTALARFGAGELAAFLKQHRPPNQEGGQGGGGGGEPAELSSITHTQEAGVDEGGIVKAHGDHFVVLRRGQLFSVANKDGVADTLRPLSPAMTVNPEVCDQSMPEALRYYAVTATIPLNLRDAPSTRGNILAKLQPGTTYEGGYTHYQCVRRDCSRKPTADGWLPVVDPISAAAGWAMQGAGGETWLTPSADCAGYFYGIWYDELLVKDDTLVVVGYNYERKATEIALFQIDAAGRITRLPDARYFLRSNDYYSTGNYMSRLVDGKLVFYMPYFLYRAVWNPALGNYGTMTYEPAELPAMQQGNLGRWTPLFDETQIYKPIQNVTLPSLYTVLTCDLQPRLSCYARAIVGPSSWNTPYYVSREAIYLWLTNNGWYDQPAASSDAALIRMPVLGNKLSALYVQGTPSDQFSFKERDGNLHVLVRAGAQLQGGYFDPSRGPAKLATIPLSSFSSTVQQLAPAQYATLAAPEEAYELKNRFVGDFVLYGEAGGYYSAGASRTLYAYNYAARWAAAQAIQLDHDIARIEPMGDRAVVMGQRDNDLLISAITLGDAPAVSASHVEPAAIQAESRSHAYYFDPQQSIMALPIVTWGDSGYGTVGDARMLFFRVYPERFAALGELVANAGTAQCVSSCWDWYGNARPIFYQGRIFALLGYELLEGELLAGQDRLRQLRRVDFSTVLGQ
jgi:hypothetical protein